MHMLPGKRRFEACEVLELLACHMLAKTLWKGPDVVAVVVRIGLAGVVVIVVVTIGIIKNGKLCVSISTG